jgi:hypothetical protein
MFLITVNTHLSLVLPYADCIGGPQVYQSAVHAEVPVVGLVFANESSSASIIGGLDPDAGILRLIAKSVMVSNLEYLVSEVYKNMNTCSR